MKGRHLYAGGEDVFLGLAGEGWRQEWEETLPTGRKAGRGVRKIGKAGKFKQEGNISRQAA